MMEKEVKENNTEETVEEMGFLESIISSVSKAREEFHRAKNLKRSKLNMLRVEGKDPIGKGRLSKSRKKPREFAGIYRSW